MSDTYTDLLCPKCGANIEATVETKRVVTFADVEYGYLGLQAKTPKQYWEHPHGEDTGECENLDCNDTDCDSDHNFDKQKNRELLEDPSTELVFNIDWDYSEEESEDIIRVTKLKCIDSACDWSRVVTQTQPVKVVPN